MKIVVRINFEFVSYDVFAHCKALAWVFNTSKSKVYKVQFPSQ